MTHTTTATAPGKIILIGEHAVVYGRPAIATPVWGVSAIATITQLPTGSRCTIEAPDIQVRFALASAPQEHPLALTMRRTLNRLGLYNEPDWRVVVRSTLPIAGGLGSGAAISAALVKAICAHVGHPAEPAFVSDIVYASEQIHHGLPSGIDNTVIAYGKPIWFVKGEPPQPFIPKAPITIVIADSGIHSPTKETVGHVRTAWAADQPRYEALFDEIAQIAKSARQAIEAHDLAQLGNLFNQNHQLLQILDVSSPVLDLLVERARLAGALGAKLSGGGRGGNIIALTTPEQVGMVQEGLLQSGAVRVLTTTIGEGQG